jgi:hypothetical protein
MNNRLYTALLLITVFFISHSALAQSYEDRMKSYNPEYILYKKKCVKLDLPILKPFLINKSNTWEKIYARAYNGHFDLKMTWHIHNDSLFIINTDKLDYRLKKTLQPYLNNYRLNNVCFANFINDVISFTLNDDLLYEECIYTIENGVITRSNIYSEESEIELDQ